ncbi:hypothetical protein [Vibrio barjaei]|uniref:hypothetical protein n=1 Tax=Vibrio barjaei TaxID=1676683 RepID=UPI0022835869|nr:hypothetical protein [Vibrio barjaei]MCY9870448.1 hypothetical protein [Vibrio barjaei]
MSVKAIIEKHIPYYYSMSFEEQNRAWLALPNSLVHQINYEGQLIDGEGVNFVSMNEIGRENENYSFASYPNLLSFDYPYAQFQMDPQDDEKVKKLDGKPEYFAKVPSDYRSHLRGEWLRMTRGEELIYGFLYTAENYILDQVDMLVNKWLDSNYPYETTISSKPSDLGRGSKTMEFSHTNEANHDAVMKGLYEMSKLVAPGGKVYNELVKELKSQTPATYLIEEIDSDGSKNLYMICRNNATLLLVRPLHILQDMERLQTNESQLDFIVNKISHQVIDHLRRNL